MKNFPGEFHPVKQPLNSKVLQVAEKHGARIFLVGGYIRDALAGLYSPTNQPRDFDYVVQGGNAMELAAAVAAELSGHYVPLDISFDTARVVLSDGTNLDFAGCVGSGIESDVQRRDFTINSLAWDPSSPDEIIDLVDGLNDLEKRQIKVVNEQNLIDDPLRILRAFRMAISINGVIDAATETMLARHTTLLPTVAGERISYELFAILKAPNSFPLIVQMGNLGVLESIFPELTDTKSVTPNAFHHLNLWEHSLELVHQAELLIKEMPEVAAISLTNNVGSGVTRLAATKMACLLHDIGKPATWAITEAGRHTFYGHDKLGADMTSVIADRLRWSGAVSKLIVSLVQWHLRPGHLFHQGLPTTRAVHRFYRQLNDDIPDLILLALSDLASTCGAGISETDRDYLRKNLIELLTGYYVFKDGEHKRIRLVDGEEVMKLLNISAGPIVGRLLEEVVESQGLGEITTSQQAREFILNRYQQMQSSTTQ